MDLKVVAGIVAFFVTGLVLVAYRRKPRHNRQLHSIHELVIDNNLKLKKMAEELESLTAEVQESNTVMQSAVTLINGLAQKLTDAINSGNPQKLIELRDSLNANSESLAAAIEANTQDEETSGEEQQ